MVKVALIDTAHWHVPLYLDALLKADVEFIGISDPTGTTGPALAQKLKTKCFASCEELIAQVRPDLAFVFGRHIDMPISANLLLDHDIPFAIEKPCGIRSVDVRQLAEQAAQKQAFVAVPFIFRLSDTMRVIRSGGTIKIDHASFRFIAGPPSRYKQAGNLWMLERDIAGGGPLINVGVHMVDLFRSLSESRIVAVSAFATSHINELSIEDFIAVTLQNDSGAIGIIECGYTFPSAPGMQRDFSFSIRASDRFLRSVDKGVEVIKDVRAGVEHKFVAADFELEPCYSKFVEHVLDALKAGSPAIANFQDAAGVLELVEAAYTSAAEGGRTIRLST